MKIQRRGFLKTLLAAPFAGLLAKRRARAKPPTGKLMPGQIWEDRDRVYHCEENLNFAILLLSADWEKSYSPSEDRIYFWKAAEFMSCKDGSYFGAYTRKYTAEELAKFYYVGSIRNVVNSDHPRRTANVRTSRFTLSWDKNGNVTRRDF